MRARNTCFQYLHATSTKQSNAEKAVRTMLQNVYQETVAPEKSEDSTSKSEGQIEGGEKETEKETAVIEAEDFMDDGTPVRLKVSIHASGSAVFDFTGTGWVLTTQQ